MHLKLKQKIYKKITIANKGNMNKFIEIKYKNFITFVPLSLLEKINFFFVEGQEESSYCEIVIQGDKKCHCAHGNSKRFEAFLTSQSIFFEFKCFDPNSIDDIDK